MSMLLYFCDEDDEGFDKEYHIHKCKDCGTTWSHIPNNINDNFKAHTCPKCRKRNYGPEHNDGEIIVTNDSDYPDYNGGKSGFFKNLFG